MKGRQTAPLSWELEAEAAVTSQATPGRPPGRHTAFLVPTFYVAPNVSNAVKIIRLIFYILMETQLMTFFAFLLLLQNWNI